MLGPMRTKISVPVPATALGPPGSGKRGQATRTDRSTIGWPAGTASPALAHNPNQKFELWPIKLGKSPQAADFRVRLAFRGFWSTKI